MIIQKPIPRLFSFHDDPNSDESPSSSSLSSAKFRSVGMLRTKSASPRHGPLSHVGSMPNLHNFNSLFETQENFDETTSDTPAIRSPPRFVKRAVISSSPECTSQVAYSPMASFEAPARLNSPERMPSLRLRAQSFACGEESQSFCSIDAFREDIGQSDLPSLVLKSDAGLKSGVEPMLAEDATGGFFSPS